MSETPIYRTSERGAHPDEPASSPVDAPLVHPPQPEKIVIQSRAVAELFTIAIRTPDGNRWWQGFIAAHGFPEWIVNGQWMMQPQACTLLPAPQTAQPGALPPMNGRG